MSTTKASSIAALLAASLFVGCNAPPRQSSEAGGPKVCDLFQGKKIVSIEPAPDSPQATIGRYVFYVEPTSAQVLGGGYLLDTATGDMWMVTH